MSFDNLKEWLNREIPISRAFEIMPIEWENQKLIFSLPLEPNRNHMESVFGGSLYCGALLVGWSWLHLRLIEEGFSHLHIVIQKSEINYLHPVLGDFFAVCNGVSSDNWIKFLKMLKRYHKSRLKIETVIRYNNVDVVTFTGDFVVYKAPSNY